MGVKPNSRGDVPVKDITVRIRAEIGAFKRDMAAAADAAKKTATETEKAGKAAESGVGRLVQTAQKHDQAWSQVSNGMVASGTAIVGTLALTGKAAMDWESAWTGVTKTVDGTPAQLAEVEGGLRNLAKTLPSTHAEIAGVAEAAGQLGIQTDSVVDFTKVMIDLGESTNLSAEEAATSLARFSNIMGTSSDDVGKLGATLVGLGNNFATTESEIMDMSMRLAGASTQIGLSEGQTMGLAAAMSSVGIEAEAGGTAMSTTMKKIGNAVDTGGKTLDLFAKTAGMSAADFQTAWKEDAGSALEQFVLGLGKAGTEGESVNAILTELGITGIRESDALLRLSSAGELMGESMKKGAEEYDSGMALIEEANKRYETAESRVKIAWNNIKDAAISAGSVMLPVIASMADAVADLAGWFADLPAPAQTALTILGGVGGVGLLAAGGMMKLVTSLSGTLTGLQNLGMATPKTTRAIGLLGKTLGGVTLVGAGIVAGKVAIEAINDAVRSGKPDVEAYFNLLATGGGEDVIKGLDFLSDRGPANEKALERYKEKIGAISLESAAAKRAIEQVGDINWFEKYLMSGNGGMGEQIEDALQLEEAMKGVARAFNMGEAERGISTLSDMATQLNLTDQEVARLVNGVPELKSALMGLATEGGIKIDPNDELGLVDLALGRIKGSAPGAADGVTKVGDSSNDTADDVDKLNQKLDDFYNKMVNTGMIVIGENEAIRRLQESINSASETITENGKVVDKNGEAFDKTSKKYLESSAALDGIASSTLAVIDPMREAGATTAEMAAEIERGRENFINQAVAMGYSKEAAAAYADSLNLIPGAVYVEFDSNTDSVAGKITEIHELVKSTPDGQITITENSPVVRSALENLGYIVTTLPDGTIKVSETGTDSTGKKIDATAGKKRTAKINAEAVTGAAEKALSSTSSKKRTATIFATAVTGAAEAGMDRAARDRNATIWVRERVVSGGSQGATGRGGSGGITRATGGPVFGPGTETSDSIPAWLSTNEHVLSAREVRGLGGHSAVESLRAIARSNNTPAFANGGAVGRAESKVKSTKRTYDRIDGTKANRLRKLAAKDQWETAKEELKAAKAQSKLSADARKKASEAAKERAKEERERQGRLSETHRDVVTSLRRGEIRDAFTSGSGLGQVDKLMELSRNKDYGLSTRRRVAKDAAGLEKALASLTKRSEGLEKALDAAKSKADELRAVRDAVAGDLRGEFSLSGMLSESRTKYGAGPLTARGISMKANATAKRIEVFAQRLKNLRRLGYGETIIQEVAALGVEDGILAAGALMGASKRERTAINKAYDRLDSASGKAGQYVTESMYKGGLDAADGLVRGLESKTKNVEDAFYKLGKNAEKSFKRSLGIKSPSRNAMGWSADVVAGSVIGLDENTPKLETAMADLGKAGENAFSMQPALTVPPSYEVSRYAQAQGSGRNFTDADIAALANVMFTTAQSSPINNTLNIDGRAFAKVMTNVNQNYNQRR